MSDIIKLSVSKTKTFLDCKAKFNYIYNLKLPRKDYDFHILGKFCHKILEDFHNAYIVNDSKEPFHIEISNAWKSAWQEYKNSMTPEMKKECWEIINKYLKLMHLEKEKNKLPNIIACEKRFEINIENKIILNGMIDRIQVDADGIIHVADYKTSKSTKYLKNDWFQLLTYAYVLLSTDPTIKKVRASYIMLKHDFEYITAEFEVPQIMEVEQKYLEYASKIQSEAKFEPNPTILCRYCEFAPICVEGKRMLEPSSVYGEVSW